jgi:hypothetical protein
VYSQYARRSSKYDVSIAQALELNPREALWLMERNLDFQRLKGNARALDSRNYILDLRLVIRNSVFLSQSLSDAVT